MKIKILAFIYRSTGISLCRRYVDKVYEKHISSIDTSDFSLDGIEQTAFYRSIWDVNNGFVMTSKMLMRRIKLRMFMKKLKKVLNV